MPSSQLPRESTIQEDTDPTSALDGYPLATRRFAVPGPSRPLVVAGGTGIPMMFYRRFARYAALRGFSVTTFDYRGIGESAPKRMRGFEVDLRDWARLDLAAVLADTVRRAGGTPVHLVGHSYGGHALGLIPDPDTVKDAYLFGTGSGWAGWMPFLERWRVRVMWNLVGPVVTRTYGYLPWSMIGMGEDLPLTVYRQWRAWCRYPRYWFDDPDLGPELRDLFARITIPVTAANAADDLWGTYASRDAFVPYYRHADLSTIDVDPAERGLPPLGHLGYFRAGAEPLWQQALDWFSGHD
jgi:predicted alpha/beta hydrolase